MMKLSLAIIGLGLICVATFEDAAAATRRSTTNSNSNYVHTPRANFYQTHSRPVRAIYAPSTSGFVRTHAGRPGCNSFGCK
jgi:hypothetical protein